MPEIGQVRRELLINQHVQAGLTGCDKPRPAFCPLSLSTVPVMNAEMAEACVQSTPPSTPSAPLGPRLCLDSRLEEAFAGSVECCVCLEVARQAVQCANQHIACASCMGRCGARCPVCKASLNNAKPARLVRKLVSELRVRCRAADRGCKAVCTMATLASHEAECPLRVRLCPNGCGLSLPSGKMRAHLHSDCPQQLVSCRECKTRMYRHSKPHHLCDVCPRRGCGTRFMRSQASVHALVCAHRQVRCPRCDLTVAASARDSHACLDALKAAVKALKDRRGELKGQVGGVFWG